MKGETDRFFSRHESTREHKTTKKILKIQKGASNIKKNPSPTASSYSELMLLILLRSYHSSKLLKTLNRSHSKFVSQNTEKTIVCVARVSTSPDSYPTRGGKNQFYNNTQYPPSHESLIPFLFVIFFTLLDKLLGLSTTRTDLSD